MENQKSQEEMVKEAVEEAKKAAKAAEEAVEDETAEEANAEDAVETEFRLYDRLFSVENPGADGVDFLTQLNPDSKKLVKGFIEPAAAELTPGTAIQFERVGYFAVDPDSSSTLPVFNRTVTLKDSWSKQQKK